MSDYEEDDFFEGPAGLDEEELLLIQQEYRRQKLKENLIGPCISTMVHVCAQCLRGAQAAAAA